MINDKANEVIEELFEPLLNIYIKSDWKHQWELVILSLILFIYCIMYVIITDFKQGGLYIDSPDSIKK